MRCSILLIVLLLSIQQASSQGFEWAIKTGGDTIGGSGLSMAIDNHSNLYVAGASQYLYNNGVEDVTLRGAYIAKFDTTGNSIWFKHFKGSNSVNTINDIEVHNQNVYIIGHFMDTVTIDDTIVSLSQTERGYIAKLDTAGNMDWIKFFENSDSGYADNHYNGICVTDSAIYITGDYNNDIIYEDSLWQAPSMYGAFFLMSIDHNGNLNWFTESYCGGDVEAYYNKIYVYGTSNLPGESPRGTVVCHNMTGIILWEELFGDSQSYDVATDIAFDGAGYLYVAGGYRGSPYLCKLSQDGVTIWESTSSGFCSSTTNGICYNENRNTLLICGYLFCHNSFGGDSINLTSPGYFVAETDINGNVLWYKVSNDPINSYANAIVEDENQNIYIIGNNELYYQQSPDFTYFDSIELSIEMSCPFLAKINRDIAIGIERLPEFNPDEVCLYPNPVKDFVTLKCNIIGSKIVELYSLSGKQLGRFYFSDFEKRIDTRNLEEGVYILRVKNQHMTVSKKLIIKR